MKIHFLSASLAAIGALAWSNSAEAQVDPRMPLGQLISAFQMCGPPQVYQMLSPQLFQVIAQQTGGKGCYPQIAAAGPILDMQLIDQRMFPVGPMFVIRVTHNGGQADWFMGVNQMTQRVEYLTFQNVVFGTPPGTVNVGPTSPIIAQPQVSPNPSPTQPNQDGNGCELYPVMCQ